jgi:fibronectin type 3 domain-containing protein
VPLTPDPVRETTYRDTAVRAGVRYVYAVVAVDDARPRNASAQSNRVEETAR